MSQKIVKWWIFQRTQKTNWLIDLFLKYPRRQHIINLAEFFFFFSDNMVHGYGGFLYKRAAQKCCWYPTFPFAFFSLAKFLSSLNTPPMVSVVLLLLGLLVATLDTTSMCVCVYISQEKDINLPVVRKLIISSIFENPSNFPFSTAMID